MDPTSVNDIVSFLQGRGLSKPVVDITGILYQYVKILEDYPKKQDIPPVVTSFLVHLKATMEVFEAIESAVSSEGPFESAHNNRAFNSERALAPTIPSEYNLRVFELVSKQRTVMTERQLLYGDSWKDEGPDGLMYDVLRKVRRLWHVVMVSREIPKEDDGVDLANYADMLVALCQVRPSLLQSMKVKGTRGLFADRETE